MKLLIVESPGKIKKIKEFLGADWQVHASVGHVRDLPSREMGVESPDFKPHYELTERGSSVISKLKNYVKLADEVYLGSDMDREGEAIAWHLQQCLKLNSPKRVRFTEITKSALLSAIASPSTIDIKMVAAQEGRRVLDRLVGYTVSPALSSLAGTSGLSAGRVQSPAVLIVVNREREIETFKPVTHYGVKLIFDTWSAEWDTSNFLEPGQKYLENKNLAAMMSKISQARVIEFEETEESKNPPAPFITSTLQQAASNKLKFNPKKTMQLAQKLYESGHITYMRADNPNLSDDALAMIRSLCAEKGWMQPDKPRTWKGPEGSQAAHECIRPTHFENEIAGDNPDEQALYQLIWIRAVGSQLAAARYAVRSARLVADPAFNDKDVFFNARGTTLVYPGWKALYSDAAEDEEENESSNPIPLLTIDSIEKATETKLLEKKTKAPGRFTEAQLVKELERLGIGRPSTYAAIMDNILSKEYVEIDSKRYLHPTERGKLIVDALANRFSFMSFDYTKHVEERLDDIAEQKTTYKEVVASLYDQLMTEMKSLSSATVTKLPAADSGFVCPDCGKPLRRIKDFWGCTGYPECKRSFKNERNKPVLVQKAKEIAAEKCPECGKDLIHRVKPGKFNFWGCAGYPACKCSFPDLDGKPNLKK